VATLRLFTAITFPEKVIEELRKVLASVTPVQAAVKWVEKGHLHLTLVFLGDVAEERLPLVVEMLEQASGAVAPFELELGGVGAFPNLGHPKVLFVPALQGKEKAGELARAVSKSLAQIGVEPEERDYHAHVTLGRVKANRGVEEAVRQLEKTCPLSLGKTMASAFTLFQSRLNAQGPHYSVIREFSLKS
jgi:RNA 2',3'-cyclic 3'-phosphodiesterase